MLHTNFIFCIYYLIHKIYLKQNGDKYTFIFFLQLQLTDKYIILLTTLFYCNFLIIICIHSSQVYAFLIYTIYTLFLLFLHLYQYVINRI